MANKVLTIVFDTLEAKLDPIIAAAVNEIQKAGHTLKQIRVTSDSGEVVVPANTVEGVEPPPSEEPVPEPAPAPAPEPAPAEPAPVEPPADVPPVDVPPVDAPPAEAPAPA